MITVGYQYVYDLYYRVRHACLEHKVYSLDFLDWMKAGIAFNALGTKNPTRHAAYFGKLYQGLFTNQRHVTLEEMKTAVIRYYEDIFQLYQDHLVAQLQIASKRSDSLAPNSLVLLPSFEGVPVMYEYLPMEDIVLSQYNCKYREELLQQAATIYMDEDSLLFRGMSLMFDYGIKREGDGIILGVK